MDAHNATELIITVLKTHVIIAPLVLELTIITNLTNLQPIR